MFHAGQKIGFYTLIKLLGRGGFGEVWLAENRAKYATTQVAVKLPLDEQVDHAAIEHEAQLWAKASGHSNILPIIEANEYDGQVVIVSEYAPDGSLEEWLRQNGKMPVEKAIQTTIQILDGLEFLHARQIIHRDLKPANILLQGSTPRLADFGISRVIKTSLHATTAAGTPYYMSPEAFRRERTIQTDIWSVGVMLYQMLKGELPFFGNDIAEVFYAVTEENPKPLPDYISPDLQGIVLKSLAKEPAERYKYAEEMRKDLDKVLTRLRSATYTPRENIEQSLLHEAVTEKIPAEVEIQTEEINKKSTAGKFLDNQPTVTKPAFQLESIVTKDKAGIIKTEIKKQNFDAAAAVFLQPNEKTVTGETYKARKRNILGISIAGIIILLLFLNVYYWKNPDTPSITLNNSTIKVGVYGDLSGATSSFGQSTKNGIQLAFEEINAAGGLNGKRLEMIFEDDQGTPEKARTVTSKLINQDKVVAVLGEVSASNSLAAAPVAQEAKIPMITPSSTHPKVTEIGDYISRVCFIDPLQGSVMAKFAAKTLKAKTAAILGDSSSDYSKSLTQFFEQEFTKLGGKLIIKQSYERKGPDFTQQLLAIRAMNPDVIYLPGYYSEVGIIAKQARELGINQPLLGGDGWDSPELWKLGGAALKNAYISNQYSADNPAPEIQKFVKAYQAKFNMTPDSLAALAYDSANFLADAIKRAGGTESAKLKDAINSTKDFPGVTGKITLDSSRNAIKPAVVLVLDPSAGRFDFQETIYPDK